LIGRFQHNDGEADIRPVFCGHALDQGALLALRARRRVAADLPVAVYRFDGSLRASGRRERASQKCRGGHDRKQATGKTPRS
jgi:hypothetical protein